MRIASAPHLLVAYSNGGITLSIPSQEGLWLAADKDQSLLADWLDAYARRSPSPLPEIFQFAQTTFERSVFEALLQIPFGKTLSYLQLAKEIGKPKAARAVGSACGRNPLPLLIPCHRVIKTGGSLGGFSLELEIKKRLLAFEAA